MRAQLRFFWARLNANYWFYPALFAILAGALAFLTVWLDREGAAEYLSNVEWLAPVGPNGASDILTVMAGAMIGVASTVFSITLVAVTYASGNYGPRLLTNFLEDRGNQISLATFIGSFVYAVIVLRSVRIGDPGDAETIDAAIGFTPQLSLLVAYILMGLCVAVLVFFLNHVPSSIRINSVLESIGRRLLEMIRDMYPVEDEFGDAREPVEGEPLLADESGYVQMIDFEGLVDLARENDCQVSMRVRTGDFVHRGLPILDVKGCDVDAIEEDAREHVTLGSVRTPEQDPQFLIDELVEIALRALSPGINDPFTAITALHWLGAATSEIARRDLRKQLDGEDGEDSPVIPRPDNFEHYVKRGFGSMRGAVAASPNTARVMIDTIEKAGSPISHDNRLSVLHNEVELLIEQARIALKGPDLDIVEERYRRYRETVGA